MTSSSPSAPSAPLSVDALLADVREQIRLERHAHAETILDEAIASAGAAASVDPALRLERARLHLLCNTRAVDEVLLDLQALRDAGDSLEPSLRRRIGELRARGFVAKRLPTLAREELDAAAAEGDAPSCSWCAPTRRSSRTTAPSRARRTSRRWRSNLRSTWRASVSRACS